MNIELHHFLVLSAILFMTGIIGIIFHRRNIIGVFMAIELILLSVIINFTAFSVYQGNISGQIFSMFILTVAAAETALGLAILTVYFRNRGSVDIEAETLIGEDKP
ncbi:MAG: NADH-quinone oxidoreductase subunit NuoK [Alphaproteobacteria bacterium]|nr:NADH-quinone oxidoreductase subunit NuoK [Alphaproteobacteria bacterium]MCL2505050.1 NADH-quinone oxidoreductase subunit NuoK [Alphaproteobacteria bacterium]